MKYCFLLIPRKSESSIFIIRHQALPPVPGQMVPELVRLEPEQQELGQIRPETGYSEIYPVAEFKTIDHKVCEVYRVTLSFS